MSEEESLVGDVENDLEIVLDGEPDFVEDQAEMVEEANNENLENTGDESKKAVKPKRVVRNPQPKLNEQTLKEPRGLAAIGGYFERVKFKGRGYEEQDLNVLLKTYEYWSHRLFPKFPFDSCIDRLEKLGTKRATQTHLKRIRMGLNFEEHENAILRDEEEATDTGGFVDTYNDQFDQLTTVEPEPEITEEQLERIKQNMEKARRLREEKSRKARENIQNTSEVYNQMNTQVTDSCQFPSTSVSSDENHLECTPMDIQQIESGKFNNTKAASSDGSQINSDAQEFDQIEHAPVSANQTEDNEDDIDNILDFINTDDTTETNLSTTYNGNRKL